MLWEGLQDPRDCSLALPPLLAPWRGGLWGRVWPCFRAAVVLLVPSPHSVPLKWLIGKERPCPRCAGGRASGTGAAASAVRLASQGGNCSTSRIFEGCLLTLRSVFCYPPEETELSRIEEYLLLIFLWLQVVPGLPCSALPFGQRCPQ